MATTIMISAQTDKNPTAPNTNPSDGESADKSEEIKAAETKVSQLDSESKRLNTALIWLLCFTGAAAVATAIFTILSNWKTDELRPAEKALTQLQITKVKADAERLTQIETEKVRADAQRDIANARIEAKERTEKETARVESEANRKIAEARAKAESDVAAASVRQDEIALELRTRDKELADAQRTADEARLALQKHLVAVQELTAPRTMNKQQQEQFLSIVAAADGKGKVVMSCVLTDSESADFTSLVGGCWKRRVGKLA